MSSVIKPSVGIETLTAIREMGNDDSPTLSVKCSMEARCMSSNAVILGRTPGAVVIADEAQLRVRTSSIVRNWQLPK